MALRHRFAEIGFAPDSLLEGESAANPEKNARSHVWWLRDRESPANPPHNGIALGAIHSVRAVCLPASEGVGRRVRIRFLQRRVVCEPEDDIDIPVPRGSTITRCIAIVAVARKASGNGRG